MAVSFWHCAVCGRKLTNPKSIKNGIGPVCKNKIKNDIEKYRAENVTNLLPISENVVLVNMGEGISTNIPQFLDKGYGYNWGYCGGGPHNLALNILYRYTGNETFSRNHSSEFINKFLIDIPQTGGEIDGSIIQNWISQKLK